MRQALVALVLFAAVVAGCSTATTDDTLPETDAAVTSTAAVPPVDAGIEPEEPVPSAPRRFARIGRAPWSAGFVQAQILHDLLELAGYEVNDPAEHELAPDLAYRAMASGELDLWANSWYPNHQTWWEQSLDDESDVGDHLVRLEEPMIEAGGLQGFLVSMAWAAEHEVTTLDQINDDPLLREQLDTDGNGLAEIYGCPTEWTCDDVIDAMIEFAEWDGFEQISSDYDEMFEDFLVKAESGLPAVAFVWTPTPYIARAVPGTTTMWLSVEASSVLDDSNPTGQQGGEEFTQRRGLEVGHTGLPSDVCLIGPDGCQIGWLASDIEITANAAWLDDNPVARALFEVFRPELIDLSIAGVALSESGGTPDELELVAAQWMEEHQDVVDEWIAVALAAE